MAADERDLPTGRLARLSRMVRVGARTGTALLGRSDGRAAAEQAVAMLGHLRGLATKVGQMASYVDGFIPDHQSQAYARALARLQTQTPSSPFVKVQALIERELGGSLADRFAEFDRTPFASASIGQVHRARLRGGLEVAVKVQHPDVAAALENDLQNGGAVAAMASVLGPKALNAREIFAELAARFREELDYRHEASQQRLFRALHHDEPRIHVPRIIDSHSERRVLTTEFVRAMDFESAVRCSPELRRSFAELLWRFAFKSILVGGVFNADPHPGNYLFHEDGRITFLDFGCTQHLSTEYRMAARAMHGAALDGDQGAFRTATRSALGTREGSYEALLVSHLWQTFEPLMSSPFHVGARYVAGIVRQISRLKARMLDADAAVTPIPPSAVLMNRLHFGFYSVLARLDVPADYAGVDREILALPG